MRTVVGKLLGLGLVLASAATGRAETVGEAYPLCPMAEQAAFADLLVPEARAKTVDGQPWREYFLESYLDGVTKHGAEVDDEIAPGSISVFDKWSIAALMVHYGIDDSYMPTEPVEQLGPVRPWHSRVDYRRLARAKGNVAHRSYIPYFEDETPSNGDVGRHTLHRPDLIPEALGTDSMYESVWLFCPLFDNAKHPSAADPVLRSAVLVHEGQHAWEVKHQARENRGHGTCELTDRACDTPHFHSRMDYAGGDLYDGTENPYQVHYEYLCDLADSPSAWLPRGYRLLAMNHAARFTNRFLGNARPPRCGTIYPFDRQDAEEPYCLDDTDLFCSCRKKWTKCGAECVDLQTNDERCGSCDNTCPVGSYCLKGTCETPASCQYGVCGVDCDTRWCDATACCIEEPK